MSETHSSPNDSQAIDVTLRWPSIDQSAISIAPVSEAGTMPILNSLGTSSTSRVRSIASLSLPLPSFARCERPSAASLRLLGLQPGRFAHGPEEKYGAAGRDVGFETVMFTLRRPAAYSKDRLRARAAPLLVTPLCRTAFPGCR